jgi:hypothetical protein
MPIAMMAAQPVRAAEWDVNQTPKGKMAAADNDPAEEYPELHRTSK